MIGADIKTVDNNFLLRFLLNRQYRFYRHLLLLLFIAAALYNGKMSLIEPVATYVKAITLGTLLLLSYFNMYRLVPQLLFKNKYTEYVLSILALMLVAVLPLGAAKRILSPYSIPRYIDGHEGINVYAFIFVFAVLAAASAAVKLFQRWVVDAGRISELEKITMRAELQQLKNQVNPHFLFNMLNNANVLIHKDPEKASQVIMKLSDLLRYQLYDSTRSNVLLTADIHFITDFLNLEKIRRDDFEFIVSKEGGINGVVIPPLLFIVFVENAVKHSMDAEKKSYVHVCFKVEGSRLFFTCTNSKPRIPPAANAHGGLGLANVTRTLQLLYPTGAHRLDIKDGDNNYTINLSIAL